jgi:hypothetical protein
MDGSGSNSGDFWSRVLRRERLRLRPWAILLPLLALLLLLVLRERTGGYGGIVAWAAAYLAYILLLEVLRRWSAQLYDRPSLRWLRIAANLTMITWLLSISQDAAIVLWPLYLIPIMSCTAYFDDGRATLLTFVVVALAFWGVSFWWPVIPLLSVLQGVVVLVVLAVLALQSWRLVHPG